MLNDLDISETQATKHIRKFYMSCILKCRTIVNINFITKYVSLQGKSMERRPGSCCPSCVGSYCTDAMIHYKVWRVISLVHNKSLKVSLSHSGKWYNSHQLLWHNLFTILAIYRPQEVSCQSAALHIKEPESPYVAECKI